MSAISAIWASADGPPIESSSAALESALRPYGPDRQVSVVLDRVALGYYGLHTLPEDRFEQQPLWSADRSACLVADVRLDNRSDLARELQLVQPEALADSAFLLEAWLRWGSACVDHLTGAFAFAVWTPSRQELFAARDHAGERPLFYHRSDTLFALASMQTGLLALPGVPREWNESHIAAWLAGVKPDRTDSFFRSIRAVPPGHFVRTTAEGVECRQYWHPLNARPIRFKRDEEYAEALRELLDRATEARLRSVKPIGSLLSSGLDSGAVTASAARLLGERGDNLTAFTSVPRPEFDGACRQGFIAHEASGAAEVCRLYTNVKHALVDSRGYDLLALIRSWSDLQGEPPGNAVNKLWAAAILDRARQQDIGVMLEGAFGNGTISWSTWSILGDSFRRGRWLHLARTIHSLRGHNALSMKTALRYSTRSFVPAWLTRRLLSGARLSALPTTLLREEWIRRFNIEERIFDSIYKRPLDPRQDQADLFEYYDFGSGRVANEALTGIQFRDPTGDRRIYEFCFSIPQEQYLAQGHSRSLIRRAMIGRLPDSVRLRYTRGLQAADWYFPVAESLPQLRQDMQMFRKSAAVSSVLDLEALQRLIDRWPQSGFERTEVYAQWHASLVSAISLAYFLVGNE